MAKIQELREEVQEGLATIGTKSRDFLTSLPLLAKNNLMFDDHDHFTESLRTMSAKSSGSSLAERESSVPIPAPELTDPTISGWLWKRGRMTNMWKLSYYAIADSYFCEFASGPGGGENITGNVTNQATVSIIPMKVDTHSRSSVRRAMPLSDVIRCEGIPDANKMKEWVKKVRSASHTPPIDPIVLNGGGGGGGPPMLAKQFKLITKTRTYVFKSEHDQEVVAWMEGFKLVAERNAGQSDEGADKVHVIVTIEDEPVATKELSIYIKTGGVNGTVGDLRQRLVERCGVLPQQQVLTLQNRERLSDDSVLLIHLLETSEPHHQLRELRVTLSRHLLLLDAPCAGHNPTTGSCAVLEQEKIGVSGGTDQRWKYKIDWTAPVPVPALVVFHKRFPPHRNLIKMLHQNNVSDPWWREHLVQMHITPQPVRGEAHLTLLLEGTKESLGVASDRNADMYERPLLYFCPDKCKGLQKYSLETALRFGFGDEGDGYAKTSDRDGREIIVLKKPPMVAEEQILFQENHHKSASTNQHASSPNKLPQIRVLYTFVFRNPGRCIVMPVSRRTSNRFRILFQTSSVLPEVYAKFEMQPAIIDLINC